MQRKSLITPLGPAALFSILPQLQAVVDDAVRCESDETKPACLIRRLIHVVHNVGGATGMVPAED